MTTQNDPGQAVVLTVEEAARFLRISRGSAYEAARRGDLPTVRIGRRLLVPRVALDRLLAAPTTPTNE
jgi:excisionase family DNA binding protein